MTEFEFPTEIIDLPSKGLVYSKDNPLSSGKIELKYMTAKEEDILTNQSYIEKGTVIDKLLKSLIVTKVNYNDIIVGDKNAIMVAARVLGYGGEYSFNYSDEEYDIDLGLIENRELDSSIFSSGNNDFPFTLPHTKQTVTFKLLTHGDELKITQELEGLKRLNKEANPELSTRLKYMITSINGDTDPPSIRKFVETSLLARDSRALREYVNQIQPDVDLTFFPNNSNTKKSIPININFFWPEI
jgi:hypothetical protein